MVVTKNELVASLKNEVRILLHLAGKIDKAKLDYRPTPRQRSILELVQYLAIMAPAHIPQSRVGISRHQARYRCGDPRKLRQIR
jgi:hypothetical protein